MVVREFIGVNLKIDVRDLILAFDFISNVQKVIDMYNKLLFLISFLCAFILIGNLFVRKRHQHSQSLEKPRLSFDHKTL